MSIGRNLKKFRKQMGLTQERLGEIAGGISGSAISQWESGTTEPTLGAIDLIARYYGITRAAILDGTVPTLEDRVRRQFIGRYGSIAESAKEIGIEEAVIQDALSRGFDDAGSDVAASILKHYEIDEKTTEMSPALRDFLESNEIIAKMESKPYSLGRKSLENLPRQALRLLDIFDTLNDDGQDKVIDYANDIAPTHRRGTGSEDALTSAEQEEIEDDEYAGVHVYG